MGFILTLLALVLLLAFLPVFLIMALIYSSDRNQYWYNVAVSIDQLGNAMGKYALNMCLTKKGGYSFGNEDETISSAIGKNKKLGTLNKFGKFIDVILEKLDPNHSIDAIEYDE